MSKDSGWETTDVIICGCGPTGAMLSAQLGRSGVKNVCLDKEPAITTDPRGIALDEDGIRALQSVGLYSNIYSEMGRCLGILNFVGGTHNDLHKTPFMKMDYTTTEGGTGHVGFLGHKQPVLEKHLRGAMLDSGVSQLRVACTLTSISEDDDWVYAQYEDKDGTLHQLRAKFLVGADGKTGFVRKKYLEARGIRLEQASQTSYQEVWVALNFKLGVPTPETHPQFPLWRLGYTPEDVYDHFFPPHFRFLCNPKRSAVCGRFGLPEDRLWRFEFVVRKDEDGTHMAGQEKVREIVYPYLKHSGSRYGLTEDVAYPDDCIDILRSRPFNFQARSCNEWALGRVILCGDAAHVFPPFGGQGITSGFRDACALAWRLNVACRPGFTNYTGLLKAWYHERKQQLERSLAATVENGNAVTAEDPFKIFIRDTYLWLVQMVPSWKRKIEMGARRDGMVRYDYRPGMAFLPELGGGLCLPQVYCASLRGSNGAELSTGTIQFTDDVIYAPAKQGLFQLVVLVDRAEEVESATSALLQIGQGRAEEVLITEATIIIHDPTAVVPKPKEGELPTTKGSSMSVVRIATAEEFAKSALCENRAEPKYFDEYRLKREVNGKRFVLVRPDMFVFAACSNVEELEKAMLQIPRVLNGS